MKISDIINKLTDILNQEGDLDCVDIDYGHEDYPKVSIDFVRPCVVSHPIETKTDKKLVIFD